MASISLPKLLPVPADLKAITPFIQRAEELKSKNPVMAYWCIYYAAQMGLDLRSQKHDARDYLLGLITTLEDMKKDIGANDAIDNEAAGAAYVENFALNVFEMADTEDRKGLASRSTAKKFLAAANFLELLRVFDKNDQGPTHAEKVKYSKWRAADIAKAIREGRKPTPPAREDDFLPQSDEEPAQPGSSSPPLEDAAPLIPPRPFHSHTDSMFLNRADAATPGNWSTIATPGTEDRGFFQPIIPPPDDHTVLNSHTEDMGGLNPTDAPPIRKVHFSASVIGGQSELDCSPPESPVLRSQGLLPQKPLSPASMPLPDSENSGSSQETSPSSIHIRNGFPGLPTKPLSTATLPPHLSMGPARPISPYSMPPPHIAGTGFPDSSPMLTPSSHIDGTPHTSAGISSPPYPPGLPYQPSAPPAPPQLPIKPAFRLSSPPPIPPPPPPAVTSPLLPPSSLPSRNAMLQSASPLSHQSVEEVELSMAGISKAQKHARLAISALDYEDIKFAKQELLAALAALDGRA